MVSKGKLACTVTLASGSEEKEAKDACKRWDETERHTRSNAEEKRRDKTTRRRQVGAVWSYAGVIPIRSCAASGAPS